MEGTLWLDKLSYLVDKQKMNPVIFLDIDGPLICVRSATVDLWPRATTWDRTLVGFDPISLRLIRKLVSKYDAHVVLSSTWRMNVPFAELARVLELPIIDATTQNPMSREAQISEWLTRHPDYTTFAIVDDIKDFSEAKKQHLVLCSIEDGFSSSNYDQLEYLLSGKLLNPNQWWIYHNWLTRSKKN